MSLASLQEKQNVWSSSHEELGLTADQLQTEQKWLQIFNDTSDELNWEKWQDYWTNDAFLVFGHKVRIEGKQALDQHFSHYLKLFKTTKHEITRHTFDLNRGLIYQTANVTSVINGDPEAKAIIAPILMVIHKQAGEDKIRGLEMYGDLSQVEDKIKEVLTKAG
ncbi:hypothetical protein FRC07_003438 [Ceratobasidium sp. 392]|nr:hypothetical protein FRC07_003438 [Ceratobasidium sp. 392]